MAFDGIVTKCIVNDLNNYLINSKVNKFFEPTKNEIIISLYNNNEKYSLYINISSDNYRMHLTTISKPNPINPYNFCMVLRKHLTNAKIISILSYDLERTVEISFETFSNTNEVSIKKLYVELMGKHSNIILTDEKNIIIDSMRHLYTDNNSNRNIAPGYLYIMVTSTKKHFLELSKKDFTISDPNMLISNFVGFSKSFVNNIPNFNDCNRIYDYIHDTLKYPSFVLLEKGYTLAPNIKQKSSISNKLDDYYSSKENMEQFSTYRHNVSKLVLSALQKIHKKLENINTKLEECKDMNKYKLYGELITANLYKIPNKNTDSFTVSNYYDNNNLITIPLDNSITPSANAKKFFKKYKKLKNAKEFVDVQKHSVEDDINYLESIVYEINSANNIKELDSVFSELQENTLVNDRSKKSKKIKKKKNTNDNQALQDYIKCEVDGFTVLIGKNNKQNDYLTTKVANKDDIWLHVKDFHGSHVVIRTDNKIPSQETINKCAMLAKQHSKANNSNNITVDYTYVQYVKKPSGSKPGMVVYTHEQSVTVK